MLDTFYPFDLQYFAEGGDGGSASDSGEGGTIGANGLTGDTDADIARIFGIPAEKNAASTKAVSKGEKPAKTEGSVTEGGAEKVQETPAEPTEADLDKEFEDLIKGKFKNQFGKRTQGIINERFKKSKEAEARYQKQGEMIAPLYDKYGLQDGDIEGLNKAIREDKATFSRQAMAAGESTESYRDRYYSERQTKAQQAEEAARQQQAKNEELYRQWDEQAAELKKSYPSFDLRSEAETNPAFRQALAAGLPVAQAFYGANFDKLASTIAASASQQAAKKTADSIAANAARPAEGGKRAGSPAKTSLNVSAMTTQDFESIFDKVRRGEKVIF